MTEQEVVSGQVSLDLREENPVLLVGRVQTTLKTVGSLVGFGEV